MGRDRPGFARPVSLLQSHLTAIVACVLMEDAGLTPEQRVAFEGLVLACRWDVAAWLMIANIPDVKRPPPVNVPPEIAYDPTRLSSMEVALRGLANEPSLPAKAAAQAGDDSAWVLISKLQPPRLPNIRERRRYVKKHPEIKSRRPLTRAGTPHPKQLEVHVGDWIKHWDKMDGKTFDNLDSAEPNPVTKDELTEDFMDGATKLYSKVFQGKRLQK